MNVYHNVIVWSIVMGTLTINSLVPDLGEHGFIVGKTGSGKSVLATQLLTATKRPIVVVDPKHEFTKLDSRLKVYSKVPRFRVANSFIFRPTEESFNERSAYNELFKFVYHSKPNTLVYIDELQPMLQGRFGPKYLDILYQLGRSRGISVLTGTQRPSNLPINIMSEASRFYAFRLQWPRDIARMHEIMAYDSRQFTKPYWFSYVNTSNDTNTMVKLQCP